MKKLFSVFVTLGLLLLSAKALYAQNSDYQRVQVLPEKEIINHDYFVGGSVVEINGTINGDLYAGAGELYVNGTVNGDIIAAAGKIRVPGVVNGNIRAAGGEIIISGEVQKNITLLGETLEIGSQSKVAGNVVIAGSSAVIAAPLLKDATIATSTLTLSNSVAGNVEARVRTLSLTPSAKIGGDLTYWSEQAQIDPAASVSGQIVNNTLPEEFKMPTEEKTKKFFYFMKLFTTGLSFLMTLILGFILIRFIPQHILNASTIINTRPGKASLVGFISLVVLIIVCFVLFISIIGIPFLLLLLPLIFLYTYSARVIIMVFLGGKVLKFAKLKDRPYIAFLIGAVFYFLLVSLPVIGGLINFIMFLLILGTALINDKESYSMARKKGII